MDEHEKLLSAAEDLLQNRDDVRAGQALTEAAPRPTSRTYSSSCRWRTAR